MKQSMPTKEIIKFYSSIDPHTYWTLVVDAKTTTKDVQNMIVDKLGVGEQRISSSALNIVLEITESTPEKQTMAISDSENILPFNINIKKKYKKNSKFRFVVNGLDKIEKVIPENKPPAKDGAEPKREKKLGSKERSADKVQGEKKRSKEGAKIAVVTKNSKTKDHLTLIHVFYNNHLYWTLAIDPTCIVGDVCKILQDKLALIDSCVSLFEVEMEDKTENTAPNGQEKEIPDMFKGLLNPNVTIHRLEDDILVMDILKRWGRNNKWKFFVKEDPVDKKRMKEKEEKVEKKEKESADVVKSHKAPILICASEKNDDDVINSAPTSPPTSIPTSVVSDEQRKNPMNIWIPEGDIKVIKKINSGAFAKVFQGLYKGKIVAIKVLKGSLSEEIIANFKHEFTILSQVKSPHLVAFYGAYIQKKLTMVMEYCPRGTLYDVLKNPNEEFGWDRVLNFFTQTVRGIQALHNCTPPILHRDLKTLNLLVDEESTVKVADFGLSRFNTVSNHSSLGRICGTMAYCAPEVYTGERFTKKSDVYSLGIILWEMVARCANKSYSAPYSEYTFISFDFQIIIQTSQHGLRPTIPASTPAPFLALIQACWQANPVARPTCEDILTLLLSDEISKLAVAS